MIKNWYSALELAEMKLSGQPSSDRRMREKAERENWPARKRTGKGGGYEYQPPADVMKKIRARVLHNVMQQPATNATPLPETAAQTAIIESTPVTAASLKDWQRTTAEARLSICHEIKRLGAFVGLDLAVRNFIKNASAGQLPEPYQSLAYAANAKHGDGRSLSRTSIYRWLKESEGGIVALAPKSREESAVPAWAGHLLKIYQQPQKPSLSYCMHELAKILPPDIEAPSYFAANRFLKKFSNTELQSGRMGSRELRNIKPFVRRDTAQMWPTDAYTADGHTFDAEVAHPLHGRPFRPEITTVLDINTRKAVGWSAGLAESTWAVLDALRHAVMTGGIPAIFYVDNGSGYRNAAMSNDVTGFMSRLGITITHSLPYRSQARGLEERSHQSIWVRGAKMLPTYIGNDMDKEAKQQAFKVTRADVKNIGTSRLLMAWQDFINWCQQQVDDYNNRPHRALDKIYDASGKKRHMTPNEAWQQAIKEGFKAVEIEKHEVDDLFRPYKEAKTSRGEVRLFGNLYFHTELEHYHGETVRVGYDIHDAGKVWVRNQKGNLICVAEFEANKRNYFPQSFIEQAAQKRAEGRIKRAQAKIDEAMEELQPAALIEQTAIELPVVNIQQEITASHMTENVVTLPVKRPFFSTEPEKYRWLMSHGKEITEEDQRWIGWYRSTSEWEDLFGDKEVAIR